VFPLRSPRQISFCHQQGGSSARLRIGSLGQLCIIHNHNELTMPRSIWRWRSKDIAWSEKEAVHPVTYPFPGYWRPVHLTFKGYEAMYWLLKKFPSSTGGKSQISSFMQEKWVKGTHRGVNSSNFYRLVVHEIMRWCRKLGAMDWTFRWTNRDGG
jgi:hypothetical protein